MAKSRKRRKKRGSMCQIVNVRGSGRRRICRDSKGRIRSNRKA